MISEATQSDRATAGQHWRLAEGIRVHSWTGAGETALYFEGAGETMVVSELGVTAVAGIVAGCSTIAALEGWCRRHGFGAAGSELRDGLLALLQTLADFEIIETSS